MSVSFEAGSLLDLEVVYHAQQHAADLLNSVASQFVVLGVSVQRLIQSSLGVATSSGSDAPVQADPQASHSGRFYRPEWKAGMLDLDRVFEYLAHCRWFRRVRANGRLDLGAYDYYLGVTWRNHMLELHFDARQGCFQGHLAGQQTTLTFAPQGLTKADVMGELSHLLALPVYQLTLPFTDEAWRQLEYTHLLTGTTS